MLDYILVVWEVRKLDYILIVGGKVCHDLVMYYECRKCDGTGLVIDIFRTNRWSSIIRNNVGNNS